MKDLIHDGTEQPDGTIDYVQVKEWNKRLGKHKFDIKVFAEFLKYTTVGTPEDGFTKLGEEELTAHLTYSQLETIFEETEDFRQGNIGIIKSSSFSQEFNEELVGVAITQKGALLKKILCQNDIDTSYHYKYAGEDVHLFRFIVKFGNAKRGVWIYPHYSWIYAWKIDPNDAYQTSPLIDSVERANISQLRINGNPLLYWMQYFDSKLLGDYSNHSGYNSDGDSSITICNDLGNYPEIDMIDLMCNNLGIDPDNRHINLPTYVAASGDYSTLDFEQLSSNYTMISGEKPPPFVWKKVTNSDSSIDYWIVWISGHADYVSLSAGFWVTKINNTTSIKNHTYFSIPTFVNETVKRLWYSGSGDIFYLLLQTITSPPEYTWRIAKVTLSGDVSAAWQFSGTLTMPADLSGHPWQRYWLQSDLDFHDNRLYASLTVKYDGAQVWYYTQLGYWPLTFSAGGTGTSTWTQLHQWAPGDVPGGTVNSGFTWISTDDSTKLGGFRCLRDSSGNHNMVSLVRFQDPNELYHNMVWFILWDDASNHGAGASYEIRYEDYDSLTDAVGKFVLENGKGSIGGFHKSGIFYYMLPSLPTNPSMDDRIGYWLSVPITDMPSTTMEQVIDGDYTDLYRSFNSHGSADLDFTFGWVTRNNIGSLQAFDGDSRYNRCLPTLFYLDGGNKAILKETKTAYVCGNEQNDSHVVGDYNDVWPCLSSPSITSMVDSVNLAIGTDIIDKPFTFLKGWDWDDDNDWYGSQCSYLEVYSLTWWPNFQKDFTSNGGTYADEFQGIISANGSIAYFSHDYTLIKPRYSGTDSDITDNDKQLLNSINFNTFNYKVLPKYFSVELDYGGENTIIYGSTSLLNRLQIQSDYILPNRAQTIVEQLYDVYNKDRLEFEVDIKFKHYLQPCDIVKLYPPISPGGIGFYDDVKTIYQYNAGQIELSDPLEPILCMITRNEIDNEICKLTMVSLGTNPGNIV